MERHMRLVSGVILSLSFAVPVMGQAVAPTADLEPNFVKIVYHLDVVARVDGAARCIGAEFRDKEKAGKQFEIRPGDVIAIKRSGNGPIKVEDRKQDWTWGGSGGFFGWFASAGDKATADEPLDLEWGPASVGGLTVVLGNEDFKVVYKGEDEARGQAISRIDVGTEAIVLKVQGLPAPLNDLPRPSRADKDADKGSVSAIATVADLEKIDTIVVTIERPVSAEK